LKLRYANREITFVIVISNSAFSWFSLCEYVIAFANMGFHITVVLDFPKEQLVVGHGLPAVKID